MRVSLFLSLSLAVGLQKSSLAEESLAEVAAAVHITWLGGNIWRDNNSFLGPVNQISLIGNQKLTDDDLQSLKPFAKLSGLYLGNTVVSDAGLKHLTGLQSLTTIGLIGTKVTDAGMEDLAKLENLRELRLSNTAVTDAGLKELRKLKNLRDLLLGGNAITDAGLKELGQIESLVFLELSDTQVTDDGLMELSRLKNLKSLSLAGSKVTEDGIKQLQEALPDAHIGSGDEDMGQRTDPDFDVSVAQPAFTDRHPAVLFDEAHDNFHTASGRYKAFADLITNDGYLVTPGKEPFTPEQLAPFQILIIANASATGSATSKSAFSSQECDAVEGWVKGGGSLLLITDHEPFGSASQELGKRFGVEMSTRTAFDPKNETDNGLLFSRENGQIGDHPIMKGRNESETVNRVLTFTGQSLQGPPDSVALLSFAETAREWGDSSSSILDNLGSLPVWLGDLLSYFFPPQQASAAGRAQGVALRYGEGRVVVMGEAAQLSAQVYGSPPEPMGMNVPGCDNRQMALNLIHWLSGLID